MAIVVMHNAARVMHNAEAAVNGSLLYLIFVAMAGNRRWIQVTQMLFIHMTYPQESTFVHNAIVSSPY